MKKFISCLSALVLCFSLVIVGCLDVKAEGIEDLGKIVDGSKLINEKYSESSMRTPESPVTNKCTAFFCSTFNTSGIYHLFIINNYTTIYQYSPCWNLSTAIMLLIIKLRL